MGFLDTIDFPADKQDVIAAAADHGEPQDVVEALQRASVECFEDRAAVEAELNAAA